MSAAGAPNEQFYVVGGTVDPDSPSYVERRADADLLNSLRSGELCHVLASRQMGKSSLMARTARRLTAEGFQCAIVDITIFSEKRGAADDWYYALVDHIANKLELDLDIGAWWQENSRLPPLGKLTKFLDKVVLDGCAGRVVIFIDEIDSTIRLPFSDDFFAAIRACFNARASAPRFKRLNFVLLGVATPAQLIRDPTRTPFNVGRGIVLTDFTEDEAAALARGLHPDRERAADLLRRVLDWTDGHPYLTQTLCWHLVRNSTWELDEIIAEIFLSKRAAREEPNLRLVRDRLTQGGSELADVLLVYKKIVEGEPVRDEPTSPVHASLRLSGVVKVDMAGELKVRNRIYRKVFSTNWVASELPAERPHERTLPPDIAEVYATYDALRSLPEFRRTATGILARSYELRGMRDEALLIRIRDLFESPSDRKRMLVQTIIDADYRELLASFVQDAGINAAALSPDGARVLTGGQDGTARLWSTFSGDSIIGPLRHLRAVTAVAFSPNGKWLATGGDDNTAYIWNAETGERSAPLSHQARVRYLAFSPDSRRLLTTSSDGSAGVWDVNTGQLTGMMLQHLDSVQMGAFSPDGKRVATASQDRTAVLWAAGSGQFGSALLHGGAVTSLGFHPTQALLITCSEDRLVRLWGTETESLVSTFAHNGPVLDFAFSPDGTRIVTASQDWTARIWQLDPPYPQIAELRHHDTVSSVAYTPDGECVLSGSADRTMRVWSARDGVPVGLTYRHRGSLVSLACNADGSRVLTASREGARLWRLDRSARVDTQSFHHSAAISCAAFSVNGLSLAVGDAGGTVRIWALPGGEGGAVSFSHDSPVSSVAFSPDSAVLATACEDGSVSLWSSGGERLGFSVRHAATVRVLQFSREGNLLASGSDDGTARIWHLDSAELAGSFQLRGSVGSLAFSPDGRLLATGGFDRSARVWSLDTGKELGLALEHPSAVTTVAYDPHHQAWLSGFGKTIQLWRLQRVWRREDSTFEFDPSIIYTLQLGTRVEFASFDPAGGRFVAVTESWLHYFSIIEDGAVPIASRLLPGVWIGAFRWCEDLNTIDLALLDTRDRFRIFRLGLDPPDVPPVDGDPVNLLSDWETRLGQHADKNARILADF